MLGGLFGGVALVSDYETRSISPENPDGRRGGGGRHVPVEAENPARKLGVGWKARPHVTVKAGETITMAEMSGPGVIQHIWLTVCPWFITDGVLRIYWDGEAEPSVEAPLGDFFCNGHGLRYDVSSVMIASNPNGGFNCYFPMPFRKSARITIENQGTQDHVGLYYQVTYALGPVPDEAAYFHAQYRRSMTQRENPEHVILDGVKGRGHYVGTHIAWTQMSNGWWGEGEVKFFIDGDGEFPTICGTGTEDYIGGAWNFGDRTFSGPWMGYPLFKKVEAEVPRHGMYRWHVLDPVRFKEDLRVTVQALGWWPDKTFQPLTDDIATVAYWYQVEPHGAFPALVGREGRWGR